MKQLDRCQLFLFISLMLVFSFIQSYPVETSPADTDFFINPIDISLGTTGSWQTIGLSTYIPTGTEVVFVWVVNNDDGNYFEYGLRQGDSNDNRHSDIWSSGSLYTAVGVDTDRQIDGYIESTEVDFYLVGYTDEGGGFATSIDVSTGATGEWVDVDVSSYVPEGTTGVILEVVNTGASEISWGVRKKGSSDWQALYIRDGCHCWAFTGVDSNRVFQQKIMNTDVDMYLVGYLEGGFTFLTDAVDASLSTTSAWTEVDCSM